MELEWHDFEYEEPPTHRAIWVYLGSNQIELVYIKPSPLLNPEELICVRVLDSSVSVDRTAIKAWHELVYPPAPRKVWTT